MPRNTKQWKQAHDRWVSARRAYLGWISVALAIERRGIESTAASDMRGMKIGSPLPRATAVPPTSAAELLDQRDHHRKKQREVACELRDAAVQLAGAISDLPLRVPVLRLRRDVQEEVHRLVSVDRECHLVLPETKVARDSLREVDLVVEAISGLMSGPMTEARPAFWVVLEHIAGSEDAPDQTQADVVDKMSRAGCFHDKSTVSKAIAHWRDRSIPFVEESICRRTRAGDDAVAERIGSLPELP
jgi:hypothetical protein